jgi:EpsI family protein
MMIGRRDLIVGAACLAGAGVAYALQPRRHVSLLERGRTVEEIVPRAFASWKSQDVTDLVAPKIEDSLASRLYGETVGRVYRNGETGEEIMMLLAHGDTQSEDLQLHRPEICYPAFGFSISQNAVTNVGLAANVAIPSRRLVAEAPDRRENIVYWSRLGEFLPLDRRQQQLDRLKTAMQGDIADGMLARFSMLSADSVAAVAVLQRFIPLLVRAVAPDQRDVLIGSQRAAALAAARI